MQAQELKGLRPPLLQDHRKVSLWFGSRGISIRAWCKANKLSHNVVAGLLRGALKGKYGQAFQVAVILGLKPPPDDADGASIHGGLHMNPNTNGLGHAQGAC
jgi:gp16 family phage-associated protein